MDPRLLEYYNQELRHLREVGGEFAEEFPKIAGRLGLDAFECADPYVERLLEGFAFLTARIRLRLDAEFPRFTQHLLQMVYPHYLAPTPSMAVVHLQPDLEDGSLREGFSVPRHSLLRSAIGGGLRTACQYRTSHALQLWPVKVEEADYFSSTGAVATLGVPDTRGVKAGIRLRLKATAGLRFDELDLDRLSFFLHGSDALPMRIYEQLLGNTVGVVVRPPGKPSPWQQVLESRTLRGVGFADDEALLPYTRRSFHGYRLLHEYFAFPRRFLFVALEGLRQAVGRCDGDVLELIFLLREGDSNLDGVLSPEQFLLNCVPAINLFPHRADRIDLRKRQGEYHIIADRTRPLDFEIYDVMAAVGYGAGAEKACDFRPLYSSLDRDGSDVTGPFYVLRREPRLLGSKQRREGSRSTYVGSETFISLVDPREAPWSGDLRQLALQVLCTNRDLPLHMPAGQAQTDFTMDASGPVERIRCVAGPTRPRPALAQGNATWRLISHLSLNYLSIVDADGEEGVDEGATGLRALLGLYGNAADATVRKQIEGVRSVRSRGIVRRLPIHGPVSFGRGLEITLEAEETAFEGSSVFLLGAVLERFFERYVSMNSFTETVVRTVERGEIMRWPTRIGLRHRL